MIFFLVLLIALLMAPASVTSATVPVSKNLHTIQVAAFLSHARAMREMETLKQQGFSPFILNIYDDQHQLWYTIHVGKHARFQAAKTEMSEFSSKTGKKAIIFSKPPESLALFESRVLGKIPDKEQPEIESSQIQIEPSQEEQVEPIQQEQIEPTEAEAVELALEQGEPIEEEQIEPVQEQVEATQEQSESVQHTSPEPAQKAYVLASIGISHIGKSSSDLDDDLADSGYPTTSNIDRTNVGWKIVGGYKFTKRLGVEAGYVHFQNVDTKISTSSATDGLAEEVAKYAPLSIKGAVVEGVAFWDVTPKLSLLGKAGGFFWKGKVNANNQGVTVAREDEGMDLVLGAGAKLNFWEKTSLRLEYERFFTPDHIDLYSVGVEVGF